MNFMKFLKHSHGQKIEIIFQLRLVVICNLFRCKLQSLRSKRFNFFLLYRIILAKEFFIRRNELWLYIHSCRVARICSLCVYAWVSVCVRTCTCAAHMLVTGFFFIFWSNYSINSSMSNISRWYVKSAQNNDAHQFDSLKIGIHKCDKKCENTESVIHKRRTSQLKQTETKHTDQHHNYADTIRQWYYINVIVVVYKIQRKKNGQGLVFNYEPVKIWMWSWLFHVCCCFFFSSVYFSTQSYLSEIRIQRQSRRLIETNLYENDGTIKFVCFIPFTSKNSLAVFPFFSTSAEHSLWHIQMRWIIYGYTDVKQNHHRKIRQNTHTHTTHSVLGLFNKLKTLNKNYFLMYRLTWIRFFFRNIFDPISSDAFTNIYMLVSNRTANDSTLRRKKQRM